jgi:hypothetical protein
MHVHAACVAAACSDRVWAGAVGWLWVSWRWCWAGGCCDCVCLFGTDVPTQSLHCRQRAERLLVLGLVVHVFVLASATATVCSWVPVGRGSTFPSSARLFTHALIIILTCIKYFAVLTGCCKTFIRVQRVLASNVAYCPRAVEHAASAAPQPLAAIQAVDTWQLDTSRLRRWWACRLRNNWNASAGSSSSYICRMLCVARGWSPPPLAR